MSLRHVLTLLVLLSQSPVFAAPPPAAAPVRLRWKLPEQKPLGFALTLQNVDPRSNEVRFNFEAFKDTRRTSERRQAILSFKQPQSASMVAVLSPKPSGDLAAKVVVTRVEVPKKGHSSRASKQIAQAMKKMEGTVQLRGSMTDRGFVTSDLKREQRNLLAILFELPSPPVSVGDTWTHSADLVKMGRGWEGDGETISRLQLVELQKQADGRTLAVIDITLAERQEGTFTGPRGRKLPSMMEISFVGQGEFLVEEGRWKQLTGRMATEATGIMEANTEQQFLFTPLESIPPEVLAAE